MSNFKSIEEGKENKGGLNERPSTPRNFGKPKGQSNFNCKPHFKFTDGSIVFNHAKIDFVSKVITESNTYGDGTDNYFEIWFGHGKKVKIRSNEINTEREDFLEWLIGDKNV